MLLDNQCLKCARIKYFSHQSWPACMESLSHQFETDGVTYNIRFGLILNSTIYDWELFIIWQEEKTKSLCTIYPMLVLNWYRIQRFTTLIWIRCRFYNRCCTLRMWNHILSAETIVISFTHGLTHLTTRIMHMHAIYITASYTTVNRPLKFQTD